MNKRANLPCDVLIFSTSSSLNIIHHTFAIRHNLLDRATGPSTLTLSVPSSGGSHLGTCRTVLVRMPRVTGDGLLMISSSTKYQVINKWVDKGLCRSTSWINFCLAVHMALYVTRTFVKAACDNEFIMLKIQFFAPGSIVPCMCSTKSSSHKAHTHMDVVQSTKECLHESPIPQIGHTSDGAIFLWWSKSVDGSGCWAKRHKKYFLFRRHLCLPQSIIQLLIPFSVWCILSLV